MCAHKCSLYSRYFWEDSLPLPPKKKLTIPKMTANLCAVYYVSWPGQLITNISRTMNTAAVMAKTNAKSTTGRHYLLDNYSRTGGEGGTLTEGRRGRREGTSSKSGPKDQVALHYY